MQMPANPNDVTAECQPLFNQLIGEAEDLFGARTQVLPVRIRTSDERCTGADRRFYEGAFSAGRLAALLSNCRFFEPATVSVCFLD